jgi:hypothetical protein
MSHGDHAYCLIYGHEDIKPTIPDDNDLIRSLQPNNNGPKPFIKKSILE